MAGACLQALRRSPWFRRGSRRSGGGAHRDKGAGGHGLAAWPTLHSRGTTHGSTGGRGLRSNGIADAEVPGRQMACQCGISCVANCRKVTVAPCLTTWRKGGFLPCPQRPARCVWKHWPQPEPQTTSTKGRVQKAQKTPHVTPRPHGRGSQTVST